jgi:hypothetical protein
VYDAGMTSKADPPSALILQSAMDDLAAASADERIERAVDSGLLTPDGSEYAWRDTENHVSGVVGVGPGASWGVIYEWSSWRPGRGNTARSIRRLREFAPEGIMVLDPGEAGTASRSYWEHLFDVGLVDALCDAEARTLRQRRDRPWSADPDSMRLAEPQAR